MSKVSMDSICRRESILVLEQITPSPSVVFTHCSNVLEPGEWLHLMKENLLLEVQNAFIIISPPQENKYLTVLTASKKVSKHGNATNEKIDKIERLSNEADSRILAIFIPFILNLAIDDQAWFAEILEFRQYLVKNRSRGFMIFWDIVQALDFIRRLIISSFPRLLNEL